MIILLNDTNTQESIGIGGVVDEREVDKNSIVPFFPKKSQNKQQTFFVFIFK